MPEDPKSFKEYNDNPDSFKEYGSAPDSFKPDEESKKKQSENILSRFWDWATTENEDVKKQIGDYVKWATDPNNALFGMTPSGQGGIHDAIATNLARLRGFAAGGVQGGVSTVSSPLGAAAFVSGETGMKNLSRALSVPFAVEGARHLFRKDADLSERAQGLAEMAGGIVGTQTGHPTGAARDFNTIDVHDFTSEPATRPITDESRLLPITRSGEEIPYRMAETEPPVKQPAADAISAARERLTPSSDVRTSELPPEMLTPEELDLYNKKNAIETPGVTEQKIFDIARDKQGLAQDLPEGYETLGPGSSQDPDDLPIRQLQASKVFDPTGGEPTAITNKTNTNSRWIEAKHDADLLGIDANKFDNFEDLEWAITQKTAQETIRTGKNPLVKTNEPQMARTKEGKLQLGADLESLGDILGTSLYKGDIAHIATKELLQNAIDATRHLGEKGQVDVDFDEENKAISVADNGKGLTRKELETVFTDLGSSGKRSDMAAAGGFGLAKASFLLGSSGFEVTTISKDPVTGKKKELHFIGDRGSLIKGTIPINERNVPDDTQTGTNVRVILPEKTDTYTARDFVKNAAKYSSNLPQKVRRNVSYGSYFRKNPQFEDMEKGTYKHLATLDNPSATTELSIPHGVENQTRTSLGVHLLNNGMYQGSMSVWLGNEVPNIPEHISVNIKSKVPEGHQDYPFTANREEIRGTVNDQVQKYITENLINPSTEHRMKELTRLYNSMAETHVGRTGQFPNNFGTKVYMYDPKGQLDAMEMKSIMESPSMDRLTSTMHTILSSAIDSFASESAAKRLERFGIIFHDGVHGIHIPNPATKKSAILINPFLSFRKTPDQAAANILHTILHELVHADDMGSRHNENFTILLGELYGRYGAQNSLWAQDKILKAITDDNGRYNPDIQEVLQRYTESRGRPGTTEDLLVGTGIKSRSRSNGKDSVPPDDRSNGERTAAAVTKLLSALESARDLNEQQKEIYRKERAARFAKFEGVKEGGRAGAAKSLGKLRGEYGKVEGEGGLPISDEDADELFNAVKRANITPAEKARGYTALFKLLEGGNVPQRNEIALLDQVFGNGFGNRIMEMQGGLGAVSIPLAKVANTMKSMMTLIHFSAPLRQALPLALHKEWRNAFKEMFKYFADEKLYNAGMQAIEQHPYYLLSRDSGLFLSKPNDMLKGEEVFLNNYLYEIPRGFKSAGGLGTVREMYEASQRAYIGFLNKLRFDLFRDYIDDAKSQGNNPFTTKTVDGKTAIVPSDVARNIAKMINVTTGRGSLGKLEPMANTLNAAIWSPRMISSRLTMLNPAYYIKQDPFTRMKALKALLTLAAGSSGILLLAQAIGGKVNWDNPKSVDFHKARFGRAVLDPNGGFEQPIVAAARMIQEVNRMQSGKKPGFGEQNIKDLTENYLRNKETPMAHLIDSIVTARNYTGGGNYVDRFGNKTSIPAEVRNAFTPIFGQDLYKLIQDDPSFAELVGLSGANLFGAGIQDYAEKNSSKNRLRMNMNLSTR